MNEEKSKKMTLPELAMRKASGKKITMITAYDHPTAKMVDQMGIDCILVGDSLGMVVLGYDTTLPVTMEEMLHHCRAVSRGAKRSLLIGDLPFLSYHVSIEEAIKNAGRLLAEGGMDAVKLEGGRERTEVIQAITGAGIPVMGHLGLTPQSVRKFGSFKPRGKLAEEAARIVEDSLLLQKAGCFAIVLESIPQEVSKIIQQRLDIPTIGIGAGRYCDGQVLVLHDALGLTDSYQPKFTKKFVNTFELMQHGIQAYAMQVEAGEFPGEEHSVMMSPEELAKLQGLIS